MFSDKGGEAMDKIDTLIGENTTLKGDLTFKGGLHVDGQIDGSVTASGDGVFTLSEKGTVKGEVRAPVMVINGRIEGDLHCSQRLELNAESRVTGNVHYASLEMRLGAQVNGQLACQSKDVGITRLSGAEPVGEAKPDSGKGSAKAGNA
ncbi:MAG: polymer-forming cytoskeletal protein [Xanthomonadales bacterium]|nr:polymer-forming cytoskeletal protein [Xanthomonadales bacterium]